MPAEQSSHWLDPFATERENGLHHADRVGPGLSLLFFNVFFYVQFKLCSAFYLKVACCLHFVFFDGGQNICQLDVSRARWLFNIVPRVLRLFYLRLPFAFPTNFFNIHGHWHPSLYIIFGDVSTHNACMHAWRTSFPLRHSVAQDICLYQQKGVA